MRLIFLAITVGDTHLVEPELKLRYEAKLAQGKAAEALQP
jgi:hypothetical protein